MDKILILAYYWPPSGGAGVQRWLKLSWYLQEMGVQVYLICPDEQYASYMTMDKSLVKEIHPDIRIYKTKSFEPLNFYKKLVGNASVPTAGLSNVDPKNLKQRLSLILRSNLFIPDPRKFWKRYAYRQAKVLIKSEGITHVITTSPPHSVQLIGLRLKRKFGLFWISDLRDLWTEVYYYRLLQHSKWSSKKDASYERQVLLNADHICTVSPRFIDSFVQKSNLLGPEKFSFVPNGYDPRDFENFDYSYKPEFILTYTGTINMLYNFDPFLEGLKNFYEANKESGIRIRFVGLVDALLKKHIEKAGLSHLFEYVGYVSHAEAIGYLQKSFALLLFGPLNTQNVEGGIPAKIFEYLNTGREIIYVGKEDGFVADILKKTGGGSAYEHSGLPIADHLQRLYQKYKEGSFQFRPAQGVEAYSRKEQAARFAELIRQPNH